MTNYRKSIVIDVSKWHVNNNYRRAIISHIKN